MDLSRRRFLSAVAAAPVSRALRGPILGPWGPCASCVLPESRAGYQKALAGRDPRGVVIFPAAAGWEPSLPQRVRSGQWVIFESAAGFADARQLEEQRAGLDAAFGLTLEKPVALWEGGTRPPYVDLAWPVGSFVRDFSSVVPVRGGQAIGKIGGRPVAALRRVGAGALVFLGSPVGPALWSDDARASVWFESVLAVAQGAA